MVTETCIVLLTALPSTLVGADRQGKRHFISFHFLMSTHNLYAFFSSLTKQKLTILSDIVPLCIYQSHVCFYYPRNKTVYVVYLVYFNTHTFSAVWISHYHYPVMADDAAI